MEFQDQRVLFLWNEIIDSINKLVVSNCKIHYISIFDFREVTNKYQVQQNICSFSCTSWFLYQIRVTVVVHYLTEFFPIGV